MTCVIEIILQSEDFENEITGKQCSL